ncbi:MAG TPA: hypothetical protein VGD62_07975 [Acidobacteriaceae bacterium]
MADELYLSLWYPNFRTSSLGPALLGVMRQFAVVGAAGNQPSPRIHAAAAYPISWNESAVYQRIYDEDEDAEAAPERAVPAALASLHEDFAYEFELFWELWALETGGGLDPVWKKEPSEVRIVGYGPEFDDAAFEQNGQIRIDFGADTPFLQEEVELDDEGAACIRENVKLLVDFTNAIQQHCGISSRLLWSDSGESLAQKLVARLQQVN